MRKLSRGERVEQVRAFLADGMSRREIREATGLSETYISELVKDPTGKVAKDRKNSYSGTCQKCGAPTTGSNGPGKAPKRCVTCWHKSHRHWTPSAVVAAIQKFADETGKPPTAGDWRKANQSEGYPASTSVYGAHGSFDTWGDAIVAAGFPRPGIGRRRMLTKEDVVAQIKAGAVDGVAVASKNLGPGLRTCAEHFFGSWNEACRAAGVVSRGEHVRRWNHESLVRAIQAGSTNGVAGRSVDDLRMRAAAARIYGSWGEAVAAAGLVPRYKIRKPRRSRSS